MSRLAFTAGWSTSSRNLDHAFDVVEQRLAERLELERDLQAQSCSAYMAEGVRTQSTPAAHCSAGGMTSRCQMYSPRTSSRFLPPNSRVMSR